MAAESKGKTSKLRGKGAGPKVGGAARAPGGAGQHSPGSERIAKVMARAGLCSRRDAEAWIAAGRVTVNGTILTSPAVNVSPGDHVTVDGEPLRLRERSRLFLFHKPRGLVTSARDPQGRTTIFDALPKGLPRLMSVGRLDINTEGLLLLTNDGGLARVLALPSTGWLRRYRVRAKGKTDQAALDRLREGITIDGIHYASIEARLDRTQGANVWLTMALREGKNREIKRVLEHLGLAVNRLIRISFGPFQLGDLGPGAIEEVPTRILQEQLGPALAEEAGADFDGPVFSPLLPAPRASQRDRPPPAEARRGQLHDRHAPHARGSPGRRIGEARKMDFRPREKPRSGPRKHVSAFRAGTRAEPAESRKRIARTETTDRKGRVVPVERYVKGSTQTGRAEAAEPASGRHPGAARGPRRAGPQPGRQKAPRPRHGAAEHKAFGPPRSTTPKRARNDNHSRPRSRNGPPPGRGRGPRRPGRK